MEAGDKKALIEIVGLNWGPMVRIKFLKKAFSFLVDGAVAVVVVVVVGQEGFSFRFLQ